MACAAAAVLGGGLACAGSPDPELVEAYRQQRDEALSTPRGEPDDWKPDVVLHLSGATVETLVQASLEGAGTWSTVLSAGTAELEPKLDVTQLTLSGSDACDTCVGVAATLDGKTRYDAGIAGRGRVPTTIEFTGAVRIDTVAEGDGWVITCTPEAIDDLDLRLPGLPKVVRDLARAPLLAWVEANLLEDFEPVVLGQVGGEDLALRALQLIPEGHGGMRIDALTNAPHTGTVPIKRPKASVPFKLDVSQKSLLWLARREAFAAGTLPMDLVAVPESLKVNRNDFTLGLRLWRVSGGGWWRDYEVLGEVRAESRRIHFEPVSVTKTASSPGSVKSDPLAALAESVILQSIEDAVATSLPGRATTTVSGLDTTITLDHVSGSAGVLSIQGEITLKAP